MDVNHRSHFSNNLRKQFEAQKDKNILLTNKGIDNVEKIFSEAGVLKNNNFYDPSNLHIVHHVNQALRANHLFQNGRDYIVKDGQVIIIDEQTGRQLPGRRFGDGLHQSLEAKEKLNINSAISRIGSLKIFLTQIFSA